MQLDEIFTLPPYSLVKSEKQTLLNSCLNELSHHHYENCSEYRKMMDAIGYLPGRECNYMELPFLPVRLFKLFDLFSVEKSEIVKTMTSSGTTGQAVSKIFLDKETALNQTKALTKIVSALIGKQRVPMIIIDTEAVIKNRNLFSARGAGIIGFSFFGSKRIFAFDEEMNLKLAEIKEFLLANRGERILLFGFTFMIWQHFYKELLKQGIKLDLSNAVLIHGGGWKKLAGESVSQSEFKLRLKENFGIDRIHDYYGMVEQTGSIYLECEHGNLHCPIYSDVIIRRPKDFSCAEIGETGIIELVSILPRSYPGHLLLTEDEGVLLGEDDCGCGRLGKYFSIRGRLKNAEIRGCSDVYADRFQ